jgi:hypothetical protein
VKIFLDPSGKPVESSVNLVRDRRVWRTTRTIPEAIYVRLDMAVSQHIAQSAHLVAGAPLEEDDEQVSQMVIQIGALHVPPAG